MAGWWEKYKKDRNLGGNKNSSSEKTGLKKEVRVTDENRQTAKSSTWWEDYKKTRDLDSKVAANRQRAERSQRFGSANRQLEENRSRDAAEDEIRELFRNPFSSDAEWQAGVLQRNAERYKRDLPLYQQAMQNSSTWGEYFSAHRQAGESQSAVKNQFERYQQAAQKAEQDRNESNLVNRPAQWQAENLSPQEIEQRLAYYRSEAATPTVTDRDREEHSYLYPEAALQKVPHGARFDERLLEGAGQDAIDELYRPILTEQEKAAVEEADRQIIEEKAKRNYEQVQRLLAAQAGQTEATSRARGEKLIEEIAQGGEAANKAKTGKAMFEQQQKKIDDESPTIIYGAHGNYSSAMAERTKRGYILGSDWDNVPEDRKQAVYALYTENPEKAIELAKYYIADVRNAEDEERQAWYAQSGWTAALGLVSSAAAHLGAAVDPFGDVGQELTRRGDNALAGGSQWADAATNYQKIPEWVPIVGGKGAGDFYQTVGSVVQSAAVAAPAILTGRYDQAAAEVVGKLGLVLMGSSAAASDYRESVAAGMDEDRAKLHALAAGVEEALFEEVSLDKLIKMDTSGGLKSALKNWLVQSGIEGSEELATSIANRITDEMISGAGQSKVERRASELIANGMSATQAKQQAESEWMTDTLYEGFSGFLSGGMMTGGNYALQGAANLAERAVNAAETRKAQRQAGAAVSRSEGSVEALQAYAKDKGIEIKAVETTEQNAGESTEQGDQEAKQNNYSNRDYRSISDTNSKVVQSIRSEVRGKTAQEQQAVRDSLVEKYGDGIAPAVYNAISLETASRVRQEYGDVDSIQTARNRAIKEIKDESLRRAVSDGYDSAAYSLAASQGGEGGMNTMSRYIQQRNNTGTGEMSMNATVTAQDGSTKTIAITGMSEDGKRVSLADGSEVAVKDLQADADTTSAIQQLADLDLGADATKVLQAYQQSGVAGTEGYRWLMDYATAYNQGRTRQISLEQAAQRSSLDERTVMDAYTLGQQAANRETQAGLEKLESLPKRKGANGRTANIDTTEIKGKTMSKSELEQFELANQYAQALGVDMKWFSSKEKDGKFIGKNGAYENGKIYMDIHAGRNFAADLTSGILATMGHELTHFQQQYAPEEYQAIKEFLFEQIVKSSPNGEARLERLIWEKQRRSGNTLSRKAAEDEVVADACQKMLRDSKAVHDFASQQPEAANGVVRWLDKWFKRVRSIFGRGGNYSEEAQLMDSLEQDVKAAFGELWDKALKQAVQVHDEVGNIEKATTEGESKAQNSDRDTEYLEAVESNEDWKVEKMVRDAAVQWGAATDERGKPIPLYHGTPRFGFTVFKDPAHEVPFIYTSTNPTVSAHYAGDKNYAGRRPIGRKYRTGTKTEDIIENAKWVYESNFHVMSTEEKLKAYKEIEKQAIEIADKLDEVHIGAWNAESEAFKNMPDEVANAISWVEDMFWTIRDSDYKFNFDGKEDYPGERAEFFKVLDSDIENAKTQRAIVQEFYDENRKNLSKLEKAFLSYLLSYEVGDAAIDIEYKLRRVATENDVIMNEAGNINNPLDLKESMDMYHETGAYTLYGNLGDNPFIFDANGAQFWGVKVPEMGDGYYSTDSISKWAYENGYTGVVMKNIYDYGDKADNYVFFNSSQLKSADPVTYDDSGNVIPLSERFNEANEDIRFSMREPVEQTDRLIALHNLNATKLGKALDLGGFPMPSIAVTKTSIPHTNFGPITLVMDKSTIDPMQDRRNTVYSADAWTPTFPSVEYEVDNKAASRLRKKYFEIVEKYGNDAAKPLYPWANYAEDELNRKGGPEEILDRYRKDPDMMKLYLMDNGLTVPEAVREEKIERMDEATVKFYDTFVQEMGKDVFEELMVRKGETALDCKKRWFNEHGEAFEAAYRKYMQEMGFSDEEIRNVLDNETISSLTRQAVNIRNYLRNGAEKKTVETNVTATNDAIRAAVDGKKYDAWLHALFDGIVKSSGIYNGKDRYTPSGNERSFASTHYAVTLENIAKAMAAQNDGNSRNVDGFYGVKSLRAGMAKRFSSIAEMHQTEGRLQHLTEEQAQAITDALQDRLGDVTARIYNTVKHDKYDNYFIAADHIGNNLMEITEQKNITADSIKKTLSKYRYNIDNALAEDIRALLFDVSQMPVNIYEAKPERAVRFNEVLAAVVPSGTDGALVNRLHDAGVQNVIEYKAGDDADRMAKVNSVEGAQFSERDYSTPSDEELLMNAKVEDADNADQGRLLKDYQALGRKIATLEKQLAEARRQTQLTNRALNTRGIGNVVKTVMRDYDITDARHNGTAKNATLALTDGYQKALDLLDKGASPAAVNDAVYNGAVKAAEIILEQGTYSQNLGGKWQTYSASRYLGENSQELIDSFVSEAYADFVSNRYREARPETAADRLVARTKKEAQERVDKYKGRSDALAEANRRLEEKTTQAETEAKEARKAAGELFLEIKDLRQELMDNKTMSEQERKAASKKLKSLNKSLEAKREEAASWQKRAKRNASLLKSALESKSRDISALNNRLSKEQAAALEKQKNLEAKLEKQIQRERDILAGKLRAPGLVKLLKAEREKAEARVKEQKEQVFQNYKDRKNRTAIRNRIKNLHAEMSRDLLRPREGHFVPEKLIRPVVDLLDLVNTETNRAKSESAQARIDAINAAYDAIKKDERYSQFYDETVKDMLVELSGTMAGRSIYDLTTAELEDVYTVMKAMRTTIRNAIKADLIEKGKEIWEIGNEMRQELRAGRGAHALQLLEKYHMTMLSAKRAFNRFGGYQQSSAWNKVYRMLDDAQLKMLTLEMQGTRIFDRVLEGKENLEKAEKLTSYREDDLVDVGLKDETGKAVPIPRGMMLSLYMHLQNEENMRHLMYGGITLPDFKRYYKGRSEAWGQGTVSIPALGAMVAPLDELFSKGELSDAEYEEAYKEHKAEIDEIFDSIRKAIEEQLTDYDRQWIAASREFFDGFSRRELNRVTNEMYGFSKARVNNYFPIVTDSDFLKSEFESISKNISLENAGFMKERVRASNPIHLEDITKAVNRQISNVSRYAGLTQALKTFGNVYNVQDRGFTDSVKKAMAKTYGKNGQQYVENLITDMVGGRNTPGTIFDRVKGNYAQAVLAANLSVTIKQAASFPTAAATVGWGPLMKAMARGGKSNLPISRADSNLISIYSPLLWYRSKGAIDVEIGDIANGRDWTQKAKWLMGWIEKTDRATVGRLWYAAEYYVKDNYNLEKGTEEQIKNGESPFYRKVAEVFADIVEDTQPNYTILQRPDILRNPNKLVRAMVMFSTQRFQNGNILIDAIGEYRAMVRADKQNGTPQTKTARKAARQKLTRAISSQTVSAMVLSAMTLLAGAVMHRMNPWRDDDDELTFESIAEEYLNGFLSSLTGSFLAGSEVYEGLQAMLTGSKYYGNDVGGISTINELATSVVQFEQQAVKLIGDEDSTAKDWQNLAENQLWKVGEYLSQMTGIPTANIKKIIEGGRNHIADIMNEEFFSFEAGVDRSTAVNARRYMKAIQAGDTEKAEAVMEEMRENYKEEKPGLSEKAITRKVRNALASYIKEQYTSKEISEEDAISYLVDYTGKKENDAFWQIREWEAKKAHKGDAEYTFSPYEHLRELIDNGEDLTSEITYLQKHGKTASAINSDVKKYIKKQFDDGELSEQEAMKMLQKYHKVKDDRTGKYRNDTEDEAWFILDEWKEGIENEDDEEFSYVKYRKLFSAMDNDDDASTAWEEMSEHGVSDDTLKKAVSAHLQKQFQAGDISEDVAIDRLQNYRGMDEDEAYWQVDKWKSSDAAYKAGEDFNESNYRDLYAAIDGNKDPATAMKELTSHGYKESDVYTQAKKYLSEKLEKGEITEQAFKNKLSRYCKIVKADEVDDAVQSVKNSVRYKKLMESKPNLDATESQVNAWYDGTANTRNNGHESAKTAGMSIENYIKAKTILADVKDANGNRTGEDEYIAALTKITWLTPRQKDALYYERYKGTTKYSRKTW